MSTSSSPERVVVERMELVCRGVSGVTDATRFTRDVLAALERELDAILPSREKTIRVPRLELTLRVRPDGGEASCVAVARALAGAIAEAAHSAKASRESTPDFEPERLASGRGQRELDGRWMRALTEGGWSIELLGVFARAGHGPMLARWLTPARAIAILRAIAGELTPAPSAPEGDVERAIYVTPLAARLRGGTAADASSLSFEIAAVLALAWTARLGGSLVRRSPGWSSVVRHALTQGEEEETLSLASAAADAPRSAETLAGERAADAQPEDARSGAPEDAATRSIRLEALDPPRAYPTRAAGISFLLGPLRDLGWAPAAEAVRGDARMLLHEVLAELVERAGIAYAFDDPASWVLAGLRDAPLQEDRACDAATWSAGECAAMARAVGREAVEHADVVRVWAQAVLDEMAQRLAGVEIAGVIAVPGRLRCADEEVTATMPFTAAYEPLLRAGLLTDLRDVPWLDGRWLRFEFEEGT